MQCMSVCNRLVSLCRTLILNLIQPGSLTVAFGDGLSLLTVSATGLWAASVAGHRELVQLLLRYGADVNTQATGGSSPLLAAVSRGHGNVTELLVHAGADIHLADDNCVTCLMASVHR